MTRGLTVWPAALNLAQAAEYSGLCPETFKSCCPVKPIQFTQSTRGNRWLRASLDEWLSSLNPNKQSPSARRFGERINGGQGATERA